MLYILIALYVVGALLTWIAVFVATVSLIRDGEEASRSALRLFLRIAFCALVWPVVWPLSLYVRLKQEVKNARRA